jgi:hypothetical protein
VSREKAFEYFERFRLWLADRCALEAGPALSLSDLQTAVTRTNYRRTDSIPLKLYFESHKEGKGIVKWIHYFNIYQKHFDKFVGKEVNVVEIGVFSGASLEMWKRYFGSKCRVYGIDIREECKSYEDEKTKIFIGDQADRKFWKQFRKQVPCVDIVIDDGSHATEQQIVTLEEMLPHIRSGGSTCVRISIVTTIDLPLIYTGCQMA